MAVNQSKIKQWRRCQKQYSMRYDTTLYGGKRGQELIPLQKKLPLYRGSWMHALQEGLHHQWAGIDSWTQVFGEGRAKIKFKATCWQDVQAVLSEQFESMFVEEREDLGDLPAETERLFKSYLRFWRDDQDTYDVVILNEKPAIELLVEADLSKWGIKDPFKGRIDLLVEDTEYGGLWIWDAKWVKSVPAPDERMMSPQALMYVWALRKQYGLDVRGFVYNYGRTKPPTIPQTLKRGTLTLRKNLDTDVSTYLQAIKDVHGKDYKNFLPYYATKLSELKGREAMWFRRERIPTEDERILNALREFITSARDVDRREKRNGYIPRSYFYNCKFGCDYHNLCVAEFQGLDIDPLIKADYEFVSERYIEEDLLNA